MPEKSVANESKSGQAESARHAPTNRAAIGPEQQVPGSAWAPGESLIRLRSIVGNQAMTQLLRKQAHANNSLSRAQRRPLDRKAGHFAVPAGSQRGLPAVTPANAHNTCVQRHSAFEHYLLGQVAPTKLAEIPQVREIPSLQKQLANLQAQMKKSRTIKGTDMSKVATMEAQIKEAQGKKEEVRHTIVQEMNRLQAWKDNPEAAQIADGEKGMAKKVDEKWQVPYISVPCADGPIVVAYSEVNTLPDLFGNPEAIAKTPRSKVLGLLQGVRQQAYIELDNLHTELFGKSRNALHNTFKPDDDFEGARGPRAQAVNDKAYEIRMESQVNSDTKRKGEESDAYFAALERNACHFFPENKTQWIGYHTKARALAEQAAGERDAARELKASGATKEAEALEANAADYGNQAMLQNAFGEHYLQDAYAGGHLVDKTKIMQWFVQWLASNGGLGSTDLGEAQFAMAKHAADSPLKSNPQALDDKIKRGELGSMGEASAEVGMGQKPEIVFMMKWRRAAANDDLRKRLTPQMAAAVPLRLAPDAATARTHMQALVAAGFAEAGTLGVLDRTPAFILKDKMIQPVKGATFSPYNSTQTDTEEPNYEEEAAEFNLAAYNQFLSNSYIQGATKFFHDKYCKEGLEVIAANGEPIYRVYGDANMLKAGAQKGVLYQSTTSKWSREAIFELIDGHPEKAHSLPEIVGRFPAKAIDGGPPMTLENWNEQLHQRGIGGLFAEARSYGAKVLSKAKPSGSISGGNAIDIEMLAKKVKSEVEVPVHDAGQF